MSSRPDTTTTPQSASSAETWSAIGLIGVLIVIMLGIAHAYMAGTNPEPMGLHVATMGTAVATLWVIARLFKR
jgi:hypothetical protein